MKNLMIMLVLLVALSCGTCKNYDRQEELSVQPLKELYHEIAQKKYSVNEYDCSNKSAEYINALWDAGYDDALIVLIEFAPDPSKRHALVYVKGLYVDPTWDTVSKDMHRGWGIIGLIDKNNYSFYRHLYKDEWQFPKLDR